MDGGQVSKVREEGLEGPFVEGDGVALAAVGGGGLEDDVGDLVLGQEAGGCEAGDAGADDEDWFLRWSCDGHGGRGWALVVLPKFKIAIERISQWDDSGELRPWDSLKGRDIEQ